MEDKISFLRRVGLFALVTLVFCSSVQAALNLSLGDIQNETGAQIAPVDLLNVNLNVLETFYYNPQGTDPRLFTNRLLLASDAVQYNTNPCNTLADYSDPLKYKGHVSAGGYFFNRFNDETSPGANIGANIYVRVWSGTPNTAGSYYSPISAFSNGALSPTSGTLNIRTTYKADVPYKPFINQFQESTVTTYPALQKNSALTVSSAAPAATDGAREVTAAAWKMWLDGQPEPAGTIAGQTATTLSLSSDQVTAGQTYWFRVGWQNWFNAAGEYVWSDTATYTVAGAGGGAQAVTITLNLQRPNNTGGINTFAFPFDSTKDITVTTAAGFKETSRIVTINDLIGVLNRATVNQLTTFGYYDSTTQQPVGFTLMAYPNNVFDATSSKIILPAGLDLKQFLALPVEEANISDRAYSVGVSGNTTITLTGYLR